MINEETNDYYRNRFQIMLMEYNELQKQLDLYKTISTLKEDLIQEQNKVIDVLQRRLKINDRSSSIRKG